MDTALIAKVLPTKKDGLRSIGTGYPISSSLVITARHVVIFPERDKKTPISVEWPDFQDENGDVYTSKVTDIYEINDIDIAILTCKVPAQAHIHPFLLSEHLPRAHAQWEGFGYPAIGKKDNPTTREKISVLGRFHPPNENSHIISLTSSSDSVEKNGWNGISGAPVFQGNYLYAIIISTPKNREEIFSAISIPFLLKDNADFREKVGCDLKQQNFSTVISYLQKNVKMKDALCAEINLSNQQVSDSAQEIIHYLVTLAINDVIGIIYKAQQRVPQVPEGKNFRKLVEYLLPTLYGFDCVSRLRSKQGQASVVLMEIPYATELSAEILMAATDKRKAEFRVVEQGDGKEVKPGKYRFSLPPESGPGEGKQQFQDVEDDLSNQLSTISGNDLARVKFNVDKELMRRRPVRHARSYGEEIKKTIIQRWLKREKNSYYWPIYLVGKEEEDKPFLDLALKVKEDYPEINLLSMDLDKGAEKQMDEDDLFCQLVQILDHH